MTRETIEELERLLDSGDWMPDSSDAGDLLRIAKRALLLEDVLRAAKLWIGDRVRIGAPHGKREAELRAAIDRAEGKP